jgi:N-methylhydantoinase A
MPSKAADDTAAWRIAVDVGGTFTDVVATDDRGRVVSLKLLSTPPKFDEAVCEGVRQVIAAADLPGHAVSQVLHGTTAATNGVLEGSGPLTALITTSGFADVLEIGRLRTPAIYDLRWVKPRPLVPRQRRLEVVERISSTGEVIVALDVVGLAERLDEVVASGVSSIAIALINSYINDEHERALAAWVSARHPHVSITTSSQVIREPGEYERSSTAVLNAYLRPVVSDYIGRLRSGLQRVGVDAATFVMQSNGGMMAAADAVDLPVHLLESGPAAGVLAAVGVARQNDIKTAITFDMGGTTAKASLVQDGDAAYASEFSVGSDVSVSSRLLRGGGYAVRLPVVDLAEIGAGGGSIATVDESGGLAVGPGSAGAEPGPACYGRGGTSATVTDANLLLGYISAEGLARGGVDARPELAAEAVLRDVATPLQLSVLDAARAIHAVANQQMARVLRAVTTERGRDIREQTLIVSGGSGGSHAAGLADTVGISVVVVPPRAGVLSAVGLLWSPVALTTVETVNRRLDAGSAAALEDQISRMAADLLQRLADSGIDPAGAEIARVVELRYVGQATELPLKLGNQPVDPAGVDMLGERFHSDHLAKYGHAGHKAVDVVRARVTVSVSTTVEPLRLERTDAAAAAAATNRQACFGDQLDVVPVVRRAGVGTSSAGPLLVDDVDTTVVVPRGWTARLDSADNLVLERSS